MHIEVAFVVGETVLTDHACLLYLGVDSVRAFISRRVGPNPFRPDQRGSRRERTIHIVNYLAVMGPIAGGTNRAYFTADRSHIGTWRSQHHPAAACRRPDGARADAFCQIRDLQELHNAREISVGRGPTKNSTKPGSLANWAFR